MVEFLNQKLACESFEDNWLDVVGKAMRGLTCDARRLTEKSGLTFQEIQSLLQGTCNEKNLRTVAKVLSLDSQALVDLADRKKLPSLIKLPENLKRFTTTFHGMEVHSYLLWNDQNKEAIAFDTGSDCSQMLNELTKRELTLKHILLTHSHRDHINDLDYLLTQTGATAWINRYELFGKTHPLDTSTHQLTYGKIFIEPRSTPGHSPGGTTYFIQGLSHPVAIVGDALFANSVGGISAADYQEALAAIRKNTLTLPNSTILCPGHGPLTTVGEELLHNPFFA